MGRASRRKLERVEKQWTEGYASLQQERVAEHIMDQINACSVIADPAQRSLRLQAIESGFIRDMASCQCRPPCSEPVYIPSIIDPSKKIRMIPCARRPV